MDHNKNIRNMSVIAHVDHVSISGNGDATTTTRRGPDRCEYGIGRGLVSRTRRLYEYTVWVGLRKSIHALDVDPMPGKDLFWRRLGIYSRRSARDVDGADCE